MEEELLDICMNCGQRCPSKLWGAKCNCTSPKVVHEKRCDGCGRICGELGTDDYCATEFIFCPDCVDKAKSNGR